MIEIKKPNIECVAVNDKEMSFVVEPLERGFGITLGNCLRRILLSALPGAAPIGIKIEGATHEFTSVPGVKEDVTDIILNIKGLAVKAYTNDVNFIQTCEINKHTAGVVTAKDIAHSSDIEIMNPDMYICTLEEGASLNMQIIIGVMFLSNNLFVAMSLPMAFALWVTVEGLIIAVQSFDYKKVGFGSWYKASNSDKNRCGWKARMRSNSA